jgi:hypothetical protein
MSLIQNLKELLYNIESVTSLNTASPLPVTVEGFVDSRTSSSSSTVSCDVGAESDGRRCEEEKLS